MSVRSKIISRLREKKPAGTEVSFKIKKRSRKNLKELFDQYSNENFEFDRNLIKVKLTEMQDLISRSQARRLTYGLDKFQIIKLDFKGVKGIGQAFADEIFRVFQRANPKIKINYINANSAVEFMIQRAIGQ